MAIDLAPAVRGEHQALVALEVHRVVAGDVLEPEPQRLLVEQQRARRGERCAPSWCTSMGSGAAVAMRNGPSLRCRASRKAALPDGSGAICDGAQPAQRAILVRRLPGEVGAEHEQQRERQTDPDAGVVRR